MDYETRTILWRIVLSVVVFLIIFFLVRANQLTSEIFLLVFVSLGSVFPIKDFILKKTMVLGKFDLEVGQVGLRVFFFIFSIILIFASLYSISQY